MAYTRLYNYSELAKYFVESASDLESLEAPAGSVAYLVDESKSWRKSPSGEWVEIGGGDDEGGGDDPFAGLHVIKVSTTPLSNDPTKFKVITPENELRSIGSGEHNDVVLVTIDESSGLIVSVCGNRPAVGTMYEYGDGVNSIAFFDFSIFYSYNVDKPLSPAQVTRLDVVYNSTDPSHIAEPYLEKKVLGNYTLQDAQ